MFSGKQGRLQLTKFYSLVLFLTLPDVNNCLVFYVLFLPQTFEHDDRYSQ